MDITKSEYNRLKEDSERLEKEIKKRYPYVKSKFKKNKEVCQIILKDTSRRKFIFHPTVGHIVVYMLGDKKFFGYINFDMDDLDKICRNFLKVNYYEFRDCVEGQ